MICTGTHINTIKIVLFFVFYVDYGAMMVTENNNSVFSNNLMKHFDSIFNP